MIYYKAFNRDMTCLDFQYEEGGVYEIEGKPVLCSKGFHFVKDLVLSLEYYPVSNDITENFYAEVEPLGEIEWEEPTKHKGVTNKLKIIRVIPDDEVKGMVDARNNSGDLNSGNGNSGNGNSGNGTLVTGTLVTGTLVTGTLVTGTLVTGTLVTGTLVTGTLVTGTLVTGTLVTGTLVTGTLVTGTLVTGTLVTGTLVTGTLVTGTLVTGTLVTGTLVTGTLVTGTLVTGTLVTGTLVTGTLVTGTLVTGTLVTGTNVIASQALLIQSRQKKYAYSISLATLINGEEPISLISFISVLIRQLAIKSLSKSHGITQTPKIASA